MTSTFEDRLWESAVELYGDDLARTSQFATRRRAQRGRPRPRILAGGTLGVAAVAAGAVLALGGTAGTTPAYAITTSSDGTVLLQINYGGGQTLEAADQKLAGEYHETALFPVGGSGLAPGPATVTGPVRCIPTADTAVAGDPKPTGPTVEILLGKDGTSTLPATNTGGASTVHLNGCDTLVTNADAAGNSGS
jgi:hypothetical protein